MQYIVYLIVLITSFLNPISSVMEFNCDMDSNQVSDKLKDPLVTKGFETLICIHFLPYFIKLSFKNTVDKFTVLTGKHVYNVLKKKDLDILIQVSGYKGFSQQIPYYREDDAAIFPIISIKIHTDYGRITNIELEDIKGICPDNNLVPEILPLNLTIGAENKIPLCSQDACKEDENGDGKCDVKVFVSWVGTDSKGNTMISNAFSLLNFTKDNLKAVYKSVQNMDNNTGIEAKDNLNYQDIPEDVRKWLEDI